MNVFFEINFQANRKFVTINGTPLTHIIEAAGVHIADVRIGHKGSKGATIWCITATPSSVLYGTTSSKLDVRKTTPAWSPGIHGPKFITHNLEMGLLLVTAITLLGAGDILVQGDGLQSDVGFVEGILGNQVSDMTGRNRTKCRRMNSTFHSGCVGVLTGTS